jgi:hypothetical protein
VKRTFSTAADVEPGYCLQSPSTVTIAMSSVHERYRTAPAVMPLIIVSEKKA